MAPSDHFAVAFVVWGDVFGTLESLQVDAIILYREIHCKNK